ncbi:MAG: VOC family protein [Silvibacterium sp.]
MPAHAKTTLAPLLNVRNGAKAIGFYKAAFGAAEIFSTPPESGSVVAQLTIAGAEFWLADESPEHHNFSPESLPSSTGSSRSTVRIILIVDDPDAVFNQAVAAGASVVWPVADQSYHWRVGRIADPFGHHWEIGKPLKD